MTDGFDPGTAAAATTGERFKDWTATFDFLQIGSGRPLSVGGQYFLDMRCGGVRLEVAEPQGINDKILILDVVQNGDGDGGWEQVQGRFAARKDQYDSVEVRDAEGNRITLDIEQLSK